VGLTDRLGLPTVTMVLPATPESVSVTRMVATPSATAVTSPSPLTVATSSESLAQSHESDTSTAEPASSRAVGVSCSVEPTAGFGLVGATSTEATLLVSVS